MIVPVSTFHLKSNEVKNRGAFLLPTSVSAFFQERAVEEVVDRPVEVCGCKVAEHSVDSAVTRGRALLVGMEALAVVVGAASAQWICL